MARHFMAVCVVCLLCADRIPCQEHFDTIPTTITANINAEKTTRNLISISTDINKNQILNDGKHNSVTINYEINSYPLSTMTTPMTAKTIPPPPQPPPKLLLLPTSSLSLIGVNKFIKDNNDDERKVKSKNNKNNSSPPYTITTDNKVSMPLITATSQMDKKDEQQQQQQNEFDIIDSINNIIIDIDEKKRFKRHAGHDNESIQQQHQQHNPPRPDITEKFLHKLFEEHGVNGYISKTNFKELLKQLGLNQLLEQKAITAMLSSSSSSSSPSENRYVADDNVNNNNDNISQCIDHTSLIRLIQPEKDIRETLQSLQPLCKTTKNSSVACGNDNTVVGNDKSTIIGHYLLNEQDIMNVCPVLLYQLASTVELKRAGCIDTKLLENVEDFETTMYKPKPQGEDIWTVWIYAFISVLSCSILGLVGVAIIPFMDSRYYKHIIQFLVSLAVGTMTGDALLHLLPHSLAGQTERNMILKGLTCMGGIIFFYITEHGLTMISEWRKRIAKKETTKNSKWPRAKVVRDTDSKLNSSTAGDKLCKSKYSSYPYCYDEIAMDTKNDTWLHLPQNTTATTTTEMNLLYNNTTDKKRNCKEDDINETAVQSLLPDMYKKFEQIDDGGGGGDDIANNHHHHHHIRANPPHSIQMLDTQQQQQQQQQQQIQLPDSNTISTDLDGHSVTADGDCTTPGGCGCFTTPNLNGNGGTTCTVGTVGGNGGIIKTNTIANNDKGGLVIGDNDTVTVILREHESSHHGHSHKHGHVHSPPESLSAVAWMIIMGDGLHNFTDGMAIGAAFAENVAGGFSTSLAVFCHELPHELGDFAILMKAGMSVRSAVYYNLLTGVLSFIGMIVGLVFGQSQDTAQWLFSAAAGLFIYIALVDMMPEISAAHKSLQQFALQILGITSGVLLMLLIAIYEGDLMNVFSSSSPSSIGHHHHHN